MIVMYYIVILISALVSTLIDVSYLSFIEVSGATVLLSFSILLTLVLMERSRSIWIFSAFLVLFFSIFSSLPILFLIFAFMGIPYLIKFLKQSILFENNPLAIFLIIIFSTFVFQGVLILISKDFSINALNSLVTFILMNTISGALVYYLANYITKRLGIKK